MKYFLYVYPSDSDEELNMSRETDPGNSSIEFEAELSKDEGWYKKALDTVTCKTLHSKVFCHA